MLVPSSVMSSGSASAPDALGEGLGVAGVVVACGTGTAASPDVGTLSPITRTSNAPAAASTRLIINRLDIRLLPRTRRGAPTRRTA